MFLPAVLCLYNWNFININILVCYSFFDKTDTKGNLGRKDLFGIQVTVCFGGEAK